MRDDPAQLVPLTGHLWREMNAGTPFSVILRSRIPRFNGRLFAEATVLPLERDQIDLLIDAGGADWRHVEPAIFGTLLERALDPLERHKLGAHYTPRAYVERLVLPTVIEPLREEWTAVHSAAFSLHEQGKDGEAVKLVSAFQVRLAQVRVLDPACGSGNFLYVTLEHLKRLEGEVLDTLEQLGQRQILMEMEGVSVDPHQLLGLEINPRAASIAEMVLWIGYLQWHFRTHGSVSPPEPLIRDFQNIQCRDAVLDYDRVEWVTDEAGRPVTRWDGRTTKPHPVTGEPVPDENARVPLERYVNPRRAQWPEADFVVGNPPFIGTKRMKQALGDGYVEALRTTWHEVPESADYVMYWWEKAAELIRAGSLRRFGFITTNSLRQTFNRKVLEKHLSAAPPLSLIFAIPDHPWVDAADGAAVRIAMTVGAPGDQVGEVQTLKAEHSGQGEGLDVQFDSFTGKVNADLTAGANVAAAGPLVANAGVSGMGVALHGSGFILDPALARDLRTEGRAVIRGYVGGRDLLQQRRERYLIDFSGLSEDEARTANPAAFQRVLDYVKPERDHNRRESIRKLWWRFGWERPVLRRAYAHLIRYIGTTETAKHRVFQFLPAEVLADHMVVCVALDDGFVLGVLSSRVHVAWALAAGGHLGVGNDPRYNKTRCFETFPFPDPDEPTQGPHPPARRGPGRPPQGPPGTPPGADHDRDVQRAGEAAPRRAPDPQGQDRPRAGSGLRAAPDPRRAGRRRARRLRLGGPDRRLAPWERRPRHDRRHGGRDPAAPAGRPERRAGRRGAPRPDPLDAS